MEHVTAQYDRVQSITGGVLVHQPSAPPQQTLPTGFEYVRPAPRPNRAARRREGHRARRSRV
jgi:hypothetical protein